MWKSISRLITSVILWPCHAAQIKYWHACVLLNLSDQTSSMRFLHRQDKAGKFCKWKVFRSWISRERLHGHRTMYRFKCLHIIYALLQTEVKKFICYQIFFCRNVFNNMQLFCYHLHKPRSDRICHHIQNHKELQFWLKTPFLVGKTENELGQACWAHERRNLHNALRSSPCQHPKALKLVQHIWATRLT